MPKNTRPLKRKPSQATTHVARDGWHPQSALANLALPVLGNKCSAPPENRAAFTDVLGSSPTNQRDLTTERPFARHSTTAR